MKDGAYEIGGKEFPKSAAERGTRAQVYAAPGPQKIRRQREKKIGRGED